MATTPRVLALVPDTCDLGRVATPCAAKQSAVQSFAPPPPRQAGVCTYPWRMAKATWNGTLIAQSDDTVVVEGNHYFPMSSVVQGCLQPSARDYHTVCGWKGTADYFDLKVDGETNPDAAWAYPDPKSAAAEIKDHVAFWRGVEVTVD